VTDTRLTGRCFCGELTWSASSKIIWAAICHCEDCRRAASSDYVSWFGVKRSGLTWSGPQGFFRSSPSVRRSFCRRCGAPASFETDVFPDETHLYAASLDQPQRYHPTAHIFWSERVPWMICTDNLPKHPKGLQHAAMKGGSLLS
jgi:hypothetical protein